jgi:hypothetical protein
MSDKTEKLLQPGLPSTGTVQTDGPWPNLFDETYEMLLASIMVYGVMDLRTLARTGLLRNTSHTQSLLELPIPASDIVRLVSQNRDALYDEIGQDATELYLSAFDSLVDPPDTSFEVELHPLSGETSILLNSVEIVVVDDEDSNTELVYGICVNTVKKQITLIFRGCTTTMDWRVSADSTLTEQTIKLAERDVDISIHRGFYDYLFRAGIPRRNKFQQICDHLQILLERYPGYRVYCTGHSLGAALATVFSFHFSASLSLLTPAPMTIAPPSGPITCITFASPMVGNLSFEQAFTELERRGLLRALRVTNHYDIFTQLPDRGAYFYAFICCGGPLWVFHYIIWSSLFFICCQNRVYRHVGMDLHLYTRSRYKMKHTRGSSSNFLIRLAQDWKRLWKQNVQRLITVPFVFFCTFCVCKENFRINHGCQEHLKRLQSISNELSTLYIDDLNKDRLHEARNVYHNHGKSSVELV